MRISSRTKAKEDSLSKRAYQQIRNEILSGHLAIGDVLSRRKLAKRLNMSFLPITEALRSLETEGLVESRPRIGTRVRIPTEQEVRDSNIVREALESQAARLCAERITAAEKKQLRTGAKHLDELYRACEMESGDSRFLFSVHTYHMQFHMQIAELARCPGLRHSIEKEQVLIFNWLYDVAAQQRIPLRGFHSALADALCSGDPLVADAAMRKHVQSGLNHVLKRLANYDNGDNWRLRRRQAQ
jgi:GntR family transcriptional regulator, rspAB operon transcriptional repressor